MSDSEGHTARMAAAQHVFCILPICSSSVSVGSLNPDTTPTVIPTDFLLDSFWRRVSELTTRYHDSDNQWVGGTEIKDWNRTNRSACSKCANSKTKRVCIVDEDQPSCRTCRSIKIGCDRKPLFVYDMTKKDFFPSFDQFMSIFHNKERATLRRYVRAPAGLKRGSAAALSGRQSTVLPPPREKVRKTSGRGALKQGYPDNERQIRNLFNQLIDMLAILNDAASHPGGVDDRVATSQNHIKRNIGVVMKEIHTIVGGVTNEAKDPSIGAM
ncbi:hypothetical protein DFH06DRAFT_1343598 [Mycena polygramma]|nr:hypothetical protein DFH06DRAFT_1343598 [Mycena polygramma]